MQSNCRRCKLSQTRLCIVRPHGPTPADALFLIDAPSAADERLKEVGRTPQGRLLTAMVLDAAGMLGIPCPSFQILPIVFCRPWIPKTGQDRQPARDEILACAPNVLAQVKACDPAQIFFCGQDVAQYWKREYPEAKTVFPLWLMEKQGGLQSPNYTQNVRTIAEGLKNVVPRNTGFGRAIDPSIGNLRVNPGRFDFGTSAQ